jgi:hypothetical protein
MLPAIMQYGVPQLIGKEYGPMYHKWICIKTKPNSSTAVILLVVLLTGPAPPSPTRPATMMLTSHTIFLSCRCAEWHDRGRGWCLAVRYPEEFNLQMITDFEAHLCWVAKEVQAHPHLQGNALMSHKTHCKVPVGSKATHQTWKSHKRQSWHLWWQSQYSLWTLQSLADHPFCFGVM